jgi:F-box domain
MAQSSGFKASPVSTSKLTWTKLLDLPVELYQDVLSWLDFKTLGNIRLANRDTKSVLDTLKAYT